ncbi:MAG: hypothetical protein RBR97_19340, partial [Bacteroidales bacterium]|nr:hypothetical protein [Bacteroidales bacterium]
NNGLVIVSYFTLLQKAIIFSPNKAVLSSESYLFDKLFIVNLLKIACPQLPQRCRREKCKLKIN